MAKTPDSIADLNRGAVDTAMKLAQVSMESAEQLVKMQLEAARALLADNVKAAKALAGARDAQQFADLREQAMQESMHQMTEYARGLYDVAAKAQGELGRIVEARYAAFNQDMALMVDNAARSAPAGTEPAMAAMKQALAASQAMIDTMAKTAKQFSEAAGSNLKSVAATAGKPVKPAAGKR